MMPRLLLRSILAFGWTVAALSACTTQRPLPVVKQSGEQNLFSHKYAAAEKDFAEYILRKPDDNEVRFRLGQTLIGAKKPQDAIGHLTTALDVDPKNDQIQDSLAEALYRAQEREELTQFVNRMASEHGRASDYIRIAKYTQLLGHPDEAQQALVTAAKVDGGKSYKVQKALADFYGSINDRQNQVRRLRMAYFLDPENPELEKAIRAAGQVPGPTFALVPEELTPPATVNAPENPR